MRALFLAAALCAAGQAQAQCRPGDHQIGEDNERYYCSARSCAEIHEQIARDRAAIERLQRSIGDTNAELAEWSAANQKAAQDAVKSAVYTLHDATLGKMRSLAEARLEKVEAEFARRALYGERWPRMLEKVRALRSQSARLQGTIDALKLAEYPVSDLENAWLEMKKWAREVHRQSLGIEALWRDLRKDPEGAKILSETGVDLAAGFLKTALSPLLSDSVSLGDFFVRYGYSATEWNLSRQRILERVGNQDRNLTAMCKLTEQYKKTTIEAGICNGLYPAPGTAMPDPAKCK